MTTNISRTMERALEIRIAISCAVWAVFAIFAFLLAARSHTQKDDPYYAPDGNSEDIHALKY
ncbi:MAG: hypothetical protein HKN36_00735 [Hellea sp.]|nr:hypothetical protein [Hellea sp.]